MLSNFSIKKPFTIFVAIVMVGVLGVVSYLNMTTDLLPNINFPVAIISTTYPGALPQEVEMVITTPIEQSISSISGIDSIKSVSSEHNSLVILQLKDSVNIDAVIGEIREKLNIVSGYFPSQVLNSNILKMNPSMMPVMVTTVSLSGQTPAKTSQYINDTVLPKISKVEGVATVSTDGMMSNIVNIKIDEAKINEINNSINNILLQQNINVNPQNPSGVANKEKANNPNIFNITKEMIEGLLKGQNFSMSAGTVNDDNQSYFLRVGDKLNNIDELKKLSIASLPIKGFEQISLSDVADITTLDNSKNSYSKVNGEDAVILTIAKQPDYSTSVVTDNVYEMIDNLKNENNELDFVTLMDQGTYVNIMVSTILKNIVVGALLAALILLLFFKNFKMTIIVSTSILISVVTAYILMYFSGITLNVISMGGLALGIGMLVDNSIVVLENIYRMKQDGKSIKEAAVLGAKQVAGPIFGSTLTTVIVFVPILFTQGFTKQIFGDLALTITFSLFASLLVALTFVPIASQKVLNKETTESKLFNKLKQNYNNLLVFALNKKWVVILTSISLLVISIFSAITLDKELIPQTNTSNINVTITLPSDNTNAEDLAIIDETVEYIRKIQDVDSVGASYKDNVSGDVQTQNMFAGNGEKTANIYIVLAQKRTNQIDDISSILRAYSDKKNIDMNVTGGSNDISMLTGSQIAFDIYSDDLDLLYETSKQIADIILKIDGVIDVDDGIGKEKEEIRITVDKDKALENGLTTAQVWQQINELNKKGGSVTSIQNYGLTYDIYFDEQTNQISMDDLQSMKIKSNLSNYVLLSDIAKIDKEKTLSSINRNSSKRYVSITGSIKNGYVTDEINNKILEKIAELNITDTVSVNQVGENEMIKSTFSDLILMIILAVLFIYLVMVAQFQSLLSPFIVMFTIPLAFTGGFFALFITGTTLSVVSLIGLVLLTGVVVNNGIVFVDYANKMIDEGLSTREALLKTGKDRIRPVVLTACTTIFAQLALCLDNSQTANMTRGMAITSIGGLLYATILTLFLVPVMFELFHKRKSKKI